MPEAAIDKNDNSVPRKCKVRFTEHFSPSPPASHRSRPQGGGKSKLGRAVSACANSRHDPGACGSVENVGHGFGQSEVSNGIVMHFFYHFGHNANAVRWRGELFQWVLRSGSARLPSKGSPTCNAFRKLWGRMSGLCPSGESRLMPTGERLKGVCWVPVAA